LERVQREGKGQKERVVGGIRSKNFILTDENRGMKLVEIVLRSGGKDEVMIRGDESTGLCISCVKIFTYMSA
jgi:hypothetical protein